MCSIMATGNFYPHENGIFVLPMADFEETKKWLEESGDWELEDLTDEFIYKQMNFDDEITAENFYESLAYDLKEKGIDLDFDEWEAKAYRNGRLIAELELKAGYYDGCQVIVETDPYEMQETSNNYDLFYNSNTEDYQDEFVKSQLNEVYTEHNKTFFKVLEQNTTRYEIYARFSNGETMYTKAS